MRERSPCSHFAFEHASIYDDGMKQLTRLRTVALTVAGLLVVIVSGANIAESQDQPKPIPAKLTAADLEKLRWIEGTWRGTGGGVEKPFFERYRFENATTLASDSFDNEKLEKVTDTTLFELKDGEFGGGNEGSRWVATAIDDNSITFAPVVKARNSFIWRRDSKDSWTAILSWPARGDKPAGERTYKMERIK
jgi:hypothetical protein